MAILHHLRPQRRRRVKQGAPRSRPRHPRGTTSKAGTAAAVLVLATVLACSRGDQRVTETADSAVAYNATTFDSGRIDSAAGRTDTVAVDSGGRIDDDTAASPRFVLLADSVAGRAIYNGAGTCFTCHALDGSGVAALGSSLRDSVWTHIDGSLSGIARVIRDGIPVSSAARRGMPAFGSRLGEEELYRLAVYTYTLSNPGAAVPDTTSADTTAAFTPDTSGSRR